MISAGAIAKDRGVGVEELLCSEHGVYESYIKLTVKTQEYSRSVAGTVFSDGRPRIIQVRDINMDFEVTPHMMFVRNSDKPGFIGKFGQLMGDRGVNIATFNLGREHAGGDAITVVALDESVGEDVLHAVTALEHVVRAKRLEF